MALGLVILPGFAFGYDSGPFFQSSPKNIDTGQLELKFRHRFYGSFLQRPLETFFGMKGGANVEIGARFSPLAEVDVAVDYVSADSEPILAMSWCLPVTLARISLTAKTYSWLGDFGQRSWGGMFYASAETIPLYGILVPTAGIWFKAEQLEIGGHVSLRVSVPLDAGFVESFDAFVEIFPHYSLRFDGGADVIQLNAQPAVLAGAGVSTWGHHLMITVGNTFAAGSREITNASPGNGWYLGFAVHRLVTLF